MRVMMEKEVLGVWREENIWNSYFGELEERLVIMNLKLDKVRSMDKRVRKNEKLIGGLMD